MNRRLTLEEIATYRSAGHVTVSGLVPDRMIDAAVEDLTDWCDEFLTRLKPDQHQWYLEGRGDNGRVLRKLDNPVFERDVFRQLAASPCLLGAVEELIGPGLRVWFSQVFLKPAGGGGPKPMHQDNFYFGPSNPDGVVTVWVALDDATVENGCLCFVDGSHHGPVLQHVAPPGEPFNLQVPVEVAASFELTPAPVPRGSVSFHHGNTLHQSAANTSGRPRRAVAIHFINRSTAFERPALEYDESVIVELTP